MGNLNFESNENDFESNENDLDKQGRNCIIWNLWVNFVEFDLEIIKKMKTILLQLAKMELIDFWITASFWKG